MSVVALQAKAFVQGLTMETLENEEKFQAAMQEVEEQYALSEWYWEGDLHYWRELSLAAQKLGRVRSEKKAAASRVNGQKGGRPTKTSTPPNC